MPLARRFAFLAAGCPENEGVRNRGAVARSFFGSVCMTCGAWPLCHKVGTLVHVGGDFARDASGARVGRSAFKKGSIPRAVDMPRSSCDHRALPLFGPPDGVRRCSLEGSASRLSLPAPSPPESSRSWWCRQSCLLLAAVGGLQPHGGLALFHHHSASRIFITQPGCNLWPVVIHKDDYQPCGGEKRAGLRPRPYPQLQGCSSSALGRRASRVGASPSAWAGGPLLPPAFGGEGHSPALRRRRTLGRGAGRLGRRQLPRVWLHGLGGSGATSDAASCRLGGAWLSVHRTGDGRAVHGSATSMASPVPPAVPGGRTRRRTPRGRWRRSWMVLSSLPQ
jgi:hypothetical protein